jgi:hypothetical protein
VSKYDQGVGMEILQRKNRYRIESIRRLEEIFGIQFPPKYIEDVDLVKQSF